MFTAVIIFFLASATTILEQFINTNETPLLLLSIQIRVKYDIYGSTC